MSALARPGRLATGENSSMLDFLRGILILLGFEGFGWLLHRAGVPIPGGVLGLISFYLALTAGIIKLEWVERASNFLLRHMVLLFVPLTVGLMDMGGLIQRQALAIGASLLVSVVAVFLTTGLMGQWLLPPQHVVPGLPIDDNDKGERAG